MSRIDRINPFGYTGKRSGSNLAIYAAIFASLLMFFQFFYIGFFVRNNAVGKSMEIAKHKANEAAQSVEVYFRDALTVPKTYASNFIVYRQNNLPRTTIYSLMKGSLTLNDNFLAIWTMWEPNAYEGNDRDFMNDAIHDSQGNFAIAYYYQGTDIKQEINHPEDYMKDYYTIP